MPEDIVATGPWVIPTRSLALGSRRCGVYTHGELLAKGGEKNSPRIWVGFECVCLGQGSER